MIHGGGFRTLKDAFEVGSQKEKKQFRSATETSLKYKSKVAATELPEAPKTKSRIFPPKKPPHQKIGLPRKFRMLGGASKISDSDCLIFGFPLFNLKIRRPNIVLATLVCVQNLFSKLMVELGPLDSRSPRWSPSSSCWWSGFSALAFFKKSRSETRISSVACSAL